MRTMLHGLILVAALAASSSALAGQPNAGDERNLDRAVSGRVAGQPVACIDAKRALSVEVVDRTAIVYRMPGNTLYVSRPVLGAQNLDEDAIILRADSVRPLCRNDFVTLYDRGGAGMRGITASVAMGPFVPYAPAVR